MYNENNLDEDEGIPVVNISGVACNEPLHHTEASTSNTPSTPPPYPFILPVPQVTLQTTPQITSTAMPQNPQTIIPQSAPTVMPPPLDISQLIAQAISEALQQQTAPAPTPNFFSPAPPPSFAPEKSMTLRASRGT